jgi:multiple sugar transport system substrate-binding protein
MPLDDVRQRTVLDMATGAGEIDVVVLNNTWLGEFAPHLVDLSPEMTAGDGFDPDALVPSMRAMFEQDGGVYALPVRIGGRVLAYRSDLFEKAGITEAPKTWDQFVAVAKTLTDSSANQYGFVAPLRQSLHMVDTWAIFVTSYGGRFVSQDGTKPAFASPEAIAATEMFVDLYRKHGVMPPDSIELDDGGAISAVQNGRAAMILAFSPWLAQLNDPEASKFPGQIAVAPYIPSGTGGKGISVVNGWGFGVSKASKAQSEAIRFVKFAASPDVQLAVAQEQGNAPTVSSVFENPEFLASQPYAADVLSALDGATTQPSIPAWAPVAEELARSLSLAITGEETPVDALTDLSERAEDMLQR